MANKNLSFWSLSAASLVTLSLPCAVQAQPLDLPIAPATTTIYPPGVKVVKAGAGPVYADKRGRTLYGMDMRTLVRWNPDPALFCADACAKDWEPLLAPASAKPNIMFARGFGEARRTPGSPPPSLPPGFVAPQTAPDWTIIAGTAGPQWVYKGWHVVYTRKGSKKGAAQFDGADQLSWNSLKFIPPVPEVKAPNAIKPLMIGGAYALADKDGHVLFTGTCASNCSTWVGLTGGMASLAVGDWTIGNAGERPQWSYRGQPVYVAGGDDPTAIPAGATVLRP